MATAATLGDRGVWRERGTGENYGEYQTSAHTCTATEATAATVATVATVATMAMARRGDRGDSGDWR